MAQKPVIPKSRKTVERAKKQAAKGSVKEVKAVGARGSTLGNIDSLVNKHLASFRNAEKTLAEAKALVQTYREKYPQLADYIPAGAVERGIHIRENATNESEGLHKFHIRIRSGEQRYEVAGAEQHDYGVWGATEQRKQLSVVTNGSEAVYRPTFVLGSPTTGVGEGRHTMRVHSHATDESSIRNKAPNRSNSATTGYSLTAFAVPLLPRPLLPHFLNTSDVRFSFRNNGAHPNRVDDVVHRYRDQNKRNRYDRSSEDPLHELGECASQTFCLVFGLGCGARHWFGSDCI